MKKVAVLACPNCGQFPGNPDYCIHCNSALVRYPLAGIDVTPWLVDKDDHAVDAIDKLIDFAYTINPQTSGWRIHIVVDGIQKNDIKMLIRPNNDTISIILNNGKTPTLNAIRSVSFTWLDPESALRIFVSSCKVLYGKDVFDREETKVTLEENNVYYSPFPQPCKCCGVTSYCLNDCDACGYKFEMRKEDWNNYPSVCDLENLP